MADAKITRVPASGVSGTSEIDDNLDPSVLFESADGKDYLEIDTTDSAEKLILAGGGASVISAGDVEVEKSAPKLTLDNSAAGDNSGDRSSTIQFNGVATRGSGTATTLGSIRYQHLGSGTGNRAEWVVSVNDSNDSETTDDLNDRLRILGNDGTMRLNGRFQTNDGDAGNPTHSFTSSSNTGMFHDGSNGLGLSSNGTVGLLLDANNKIATNGETSPLCVAGGAHLVGPGGTTSRTSINPGSGMLVLEDNGSDGAGITIIADDGEQCKIDFFTDSGASGQLIWQQSLDAFRFFTNNKEPLRLYDGKVTSYVGYQYHAGTGADDAATEPLYLADSGATLVIDPRFGNFGDVTLTANVTAVKFFYRPDDGFVYTMTAKIKQHASSAKTIDYADSAVTVYSDGGSTSVTGEMKWSGGVHHTMSTGTGDVDIVQFTIFPNGSTFDVYAAVIGQDFS